VTPRLRASASRFEIPNEKGDVEVSVGKEQVRLTNLSKVYWPGDNITKRDLLQYYADVSAALLPHLRDRAMVMKRYPNGIDGGHFFMKRAPTPRPEWIETCRIEHRSGNVIDFPMVQDLASLLWIINLGCIDLNPWYATRDDTNVPDVLHFDLDPTPGATFDQVLQASLIVRDGLMGLGMKPLAKTTGSRGIHVYVPIVRGPTQKDVWRFAKTFSVTIATIRGDLLTSEYRVAKRPDEHILVDYNQNAWGRTLASVYSPRPRPGATVSTPVTWEEIEHGISIDDFSMANVPDRIARVGDLWKPMAAKGGRFALSTLL
jgi:bifunctional non-homologous end joining protein LigD